MRPSDPIARRQLAALLRLERAPWPAALPAYDALLRALAARCERPVAKGEVYRWFLRDAGGALMVADDRLRECLRDAFHEAVALAPALLLRFRAGLRSDRPPNLRSMLVTWIRWHGRTLHESICARHARRRRPDPRPLTRRAAEPAAHDPETAIIAADICARLAADDSPPARALLMVAEGYSLSEAARQTGASRQQVYRFRSHLRAQTPSSAYRDPPLPSPPCTGDSPAEAPT